MMLRRTLLQNTLLAGSAYMAGTANASASPTDAPRINAALAQMRHSFPGVIADPAAFRLQIEYAYPRQTGAVRGSEQPSSAWQFEHYRQDAEWSAPASTVKLPMALFTLHRLAVLGLPRTTQLRVIDPPGCAAQAAELAQFESIERTLQRMLIVSDNGAFNRLYEFVGGDRVPSLLRRFALPGAKLQARLGACSPADNRVGRGIALADAHGAPLWQDTRAPVIAVVAPAVSNAARAPRVGRAYLDFNETLISEPKDFSFSNHWRISDAHALTLAMAGAKAHPLWSALSVQDQQFMLATLNTLPREGGFSEADYPDAWGKFLAFGDQKGRAPATLRSVNKIGEAYGFLLDSAWLQDRRAGQMKECVLSAVIYVNADGVLNDDKYEYEQLGVPFLAELGRRLLSA
jgi:hypothetical protein